MNRASIALDSLRQRRRHAQLASSERAGAHSRRLIRQRHRELLRERWYVFAGVIVTGAIVCLAVKWLVWDPVDAYLIGAIGASTLWACHSILTAVDGLAGKRFGVLGDEWTTSELQKLRKQGWRFVNHVMLDYGDVDHAVFGPSGFFAIDTKYRSDWSMAERDLDQLAASARTQARKLQMRLGVKTPKVQPVVAMWGPRLAGSYDDSFERDGVWFCPGRKLVDYLRELPTTANTEVIDEAYSRLDRYVERRDIGEQRELGEPVRSVSDHINDLTIAAIAMGVSLLGIVLPTNIPPEGVWSIATALLIITASVAVRRRLDSNPARQAGEMTATITTSAGFALILLVTNRGPAVWLNARTSLATPLVSNRGMGTSRVDRRTREFS